MSVAVTVGAVVSNRGIAVGAGDVGRERIFRVLASRNLVEFCEGQLASDLLGKKAGRLFVHFEPKHPDSPYTHGTIAGWTDAPMQLISGQTEKLPIPM
jgi:hypothetical protein